MLTLTCSISFKILAKFFFYYEVDNLVSPF